MLHNTEFNFINCKEVELVGPQRYKAWFGCGHVGSQRESHSPKEEKSAWAVATN